MSIAYDWLIPALWIAWGLYWLIAARGVKPAQRVESPLSRLGHFGPMAVAGLMIAMRTLPGGIFGGRFLPQGALTFWIGAAVVASGLGFAVWARVYLADNWSGTVTLKQDHELVRDGPYRYVRHPIYTGLLAGFLGSAIALGEWRGLVALLLLLVALLRKLRLEERWMIETFGEAYLRYKAEVRMLIPFLL